MFLDIILVTEELISLHKITLIRAFCANELLLYKIVVLDALSINAAAKVSVSDLLFLDLVQLSKHLLYHLQL